MWRATRYLERMPASVAGQRGHDRAFAAAIVLGRGLCLPYEDALDVFRNDFNPRCNPPWSPTECEHKIRSAIEDGRVPMGYLLNTDTGGESRIPRPMRSSTMRSNPAPAAAPASEPEHRNDPRKTVEAAIAAGVKAQELAPLIAAVPDPITRDELVAQVSHLRNVGKGVLSGEVKRHRRQPAAACTPSTPNHRHPQTPRSPRSLSRPAGSTKSSSRPRPRSSPRRARRSTGAPASSCASSAASRSRSAASSGRRARS